MELFIAWLGFSALVEVLSRSRGRSWWVGFLLSVFLSPLIGLVIVLMTGVNLEELERRKLGAGNFVKCPFCPELIKAEAKVCRHCGRDLPPLAEG